MPPSDREVVYCTRGPVCGAPVYGPDHHGWDCPLSDPLGDCLRLLADPSANPILEQSRRAILSDCGVAVRPEPDQ